MKQSSQAEAKWLLFSVPIIFLGQLKRYFSKYCTSYKRNGVAIITEGYNLLTILVFAEIINYSDPTLVQDASTQSLCST